MASVTVVFPVLEEDLERLNHLTRKYAHGNRSAFLRMALKQMEVLDRAEQLRDLQNYGASQSAAVGLDQVDVDAIVHRVLAKYHDAASIASTACLAFHPPQKQAQQQHR